MNTEERVSLLARALAATGDETSPHYISPEYDDVLREAAARVDEAGSAGKADIAMLVTWKRIRADASWVPNLLSTSEARVREITGHAVKDARGDDIVEAARRGRRWLRELPGFRHEPALASAILCAARPDELAVYDKRARKGLSMTELPTLDFPTDYGCYTQLVEQCRTEAATLGYSWSGHEVDLALYTLGGPQWR